MKPKAEMSKLPDSSIGIYIIYRASQALWFDDVPGHSSVFMLLGTFINAPWQLIQEGTLEDDVFLSLKQPFLFANILGVCFNYILNSPN